MRKRASTMYSSFFPPVKLSGKKLDQMVGKLSCSPQFCSNPSCCGNPRHDWRWPQITRQEMRIEITEKEFLQEVSDGLLEDTEV